MVQKRVLLLLSCLAAAMSTGLSQETTATIAGKVTDASGARVARAKVTATNLDTNIQRYATTTNEGAYSLLFVPMGRYTVQINAPGFKKFEQTGLVLEVNQNAHVDAVLQIGAVSETIEVKADAAIVETGQPALGLTVNNQDIENLPLALEAILISVPTGRAARWSTSGSILGVLQRDSEEQLLRRDLRPQYHRRAGIEERGYGHFPRLPDYRKQEPAIPGGVDQRFQPGELVESWNQSGEHVDFR